MISMIERRGEVVRRLFESLLLCRSLKSSLSNACSRKKFSSRNALLDMLGYRFMCSLKITVGGVYVAEFKEIESLQN